MLYLLLSLRPDFKVAILEFSVILWKLINTLIKSPIQNAKRIIYKIDPEITSPNYTLLLLKMLISLK